MGIWTKEQVEGLNDYQRFGYMHPFTCGKDRNDPTHRRVQRERGDCDAGLLIATEDGWICPACDYTQDWAHPFMFKGRGVNPMDSLLSSAEDATTSQAQASDGQPDQADDGQKG